MPLPQPRTPAGAAGLRELLDAPTKALIALDFDGTLAPIVDRPEDALALPGAATTLGRLARQVCRVAIVTGRPALRAAALGGFRGVPGLQTLIILGQYGRERWDAATDTFTTHPVPPGVAVVRAALPDLLKDSPAGVRVEDKGAALVIHTRQAADPLAALAALEPRATKCAADNDLTIERARLALELRPPGYDKGSAMRELVEETGARIVVFVGDDLGDLPAYDTVAALREEGLSGLTVASASLEEPALTERADLVVDGPVGVLQLIESLADELERR